MSTSGLPSRRKYICNCMQHCRGEPREVSQNTWYRHAPYRSALPPIPANLVAAHHGTPFPPQTTTLANLASGSSNEDDVPFQPHKRRCLAVDTVLQDRDVEGGGGNMDVGGAAEVGLDDVEVYDPLGFVPSADPPPDDPITPPSNPPPDESILPEPASAPRPQEYLIPADFDPKIDELRTALEFQRALENASLDNGDLDVDELHLLRNPPTELLVIDDRDVLLSIKLFLSTSNASDQIYKNVYRDFTEDDPTRKLLSHARVKKKIAELTGIYAIVNDMCPNSCIAYTGPFAVLEVCTYCQTSRYDPEKPGKQARQHFYTLPLGPQLQALWRTVQGAHAMKYRDRQTKEVIKVLQEMGEIPVYDDICHAVPASASKSPDLPGTMQDNATEVSVIGSISSSVTAGINSGSAVDAATGGKNGVLPAPATAKLKRADLFRFNANNCVEWNLFGEQYLKENPSSKPTKQHIQALYNALSAEEKKVWTQHRSAKLASRKAGAA